MREALSQRTPPGPPFVRGGEENGPVRLMSPPYEGGATPSGVGGGFFASAPGRALSNCEAL